MRVSHPVLLSLNLSLVPQVVALCAWANLNPTKNNNMCPLLPLSTLCSFQLHSPPLHLFPSLHFTCSSGLANKTHFHLDLVWFGFIAALPFLAVSSSTFFGLCLPSFLLSSSSSSFSFFTFYTNFRPLPFRLYQLLFIAVLLIEFRFSLSRSFLLLLSLPSLSVSPSLSPSFCTTNSCYVQLLCLSVCLGPQVCSQANERIDFVKLTTKLVCVLGTKLVLRTFYSSGQDGEGGQQDQG